MSALEMTANGEKMSNGVAALVDQAIGELHAAQEMLAEMQALCDSYSSAPADLVWSASQVWHRLENIDDRIHEALSKLGD